MHPTASLVIVVLVAFRVIQCSLSTTRPKVAVSCVIPNEVQAGICVPPGDCPAFQRINEIGELSSTGRISFLRELYCDIDADQSGVCCPRNSLLSYRQPTLNESLPRRDRTVFATRFGENDSFQCGDSSMINKVRGGKIAAIDEFPWMAMLLYGPSNAPGCGGALISSSFVITAAHCLVGKNVQDKGNLKFVRLGEYDINRDPDCMVEGNYEDCTDGKQDVKPKRVIPHPEYSSSQFSQHHDLGLIQLERSVSFSDFIRHICLPPMAESVLTSPGTKYNVCGWGRTNFFRAGLGGDSLSPIKLKTTLPYFDHGECQEIYRAKKLSLGSGQLCAGGQKADTCAGDSGSPLMFFDRKEGTWLLTGVVSMGVKECGMEGMPGIYTNVGQYVSWIKKTANV
uniref:CLIP domain-containing serine protease n=1 Tax=Culex tarsalis TaxID=7177 RepID=A0A1Q3FIM0_CULTA